MPAKLSPMAGYRPSIDPRFQAGAYITDGDELYYVHPSSVTPLAPGSGVLVVEDCMTTAMLDLDYARVAKVCTLVRPAPDPEAPPETLRHR